MNKWQGSGRRSSRPDDLEDLDDLDNADDLDPVSDQDTTFMHDRQSYVVHGCSKNSQGVKLCVLVT